MRYRHLLFALLAPLFLLAVSGCKNQADDREPRIEGSRPNVDSEKVRVAPFKGN